MNMPTDPGLREVSLDDKYDASEGRVYLSLIHISEPTRPY